MHTTNVSERFRETQWSLFQRFFVYAACAGRHTNHHKLENEWPRYACHVCLYAVGTCACVCFESCLTRNQIYVCMRLNVWLCVIACVRSYNRSYTRTIFVQFNALANPQCRTSSWVTSTCIDCLNGCTKALDFTPPFEVSRKQRASILNVHETCACVW